MLNYLHAENAYAEAVLAPMANLTEELYTEMAGRIPASDVSDPPQRYNGFYYYEYRVPGGQFMVKARCTCLVLQRMEGQVALRDYHVVVKAELLIMRRIEYRAVRSPGRQ